MGWIHYIMFPYFHFFFVMAIYRAELLGNLIKDICQSLKIGLFSLLLPKLNILDKSLPVEWKDIPYIYIQAIIYLLPDSYKREPYMRKSNGMHSRCFIRKLPTLPTFLKADTNQAALGNVLYTKCTFFITLVITHNTKKDGGTKSEEFSEKF